jgi:parallel beta-helix repeat protein
MLLQRGLVFLAFALVAVSPGRAHAAAAPVLPGPDTALFSHPYYTCKTKFYVSPTGNDANAGTSTSTAWASLQHANDTIAAHGATSGAGTCVIVQPGTYPTGVHITAGGNAATAAGYLAYRCTVLDACIITGPTQGGAQGGQFAWTQPNGPGSYVFVDGFVLKASKPAQGGIYGTGLYGQGIQLWDGNDTVANSPFSVHHVWIVNNVISGYGQAGININDGEYFYAVHNTVYNNANAGCVAQGSGMGFVELKAIPGSYVRTPDDADNPILGHIGSFNNVIGWNVVYNNATTACGTAANPYDSDGNNIILDTLNNGVIGGTIVTGPSYPGSVLVDFNIVYNAGGRGIHLFRSENITVANNSCYNNNLDPYDNGAYRPCIGDNIGYNNSFFNNLAYGIPRPDLGQPNCAGTGQGCLGFNGAYAGGLAVGGGVPDRFFNNIAYCTTTNQPFGYGCNPMFSNSAVRVSAGFYNAAHSGDALKVSGALPGPLKAQTTYYAAKVGGNQIQFAATAADANANPPSILGFYNIPSGTIAITDKANSRIAPAATVQLDSFPVSGTHPNFGQTNPGWVNVGAQSQGTETTPPVGANFALLPGSPAIGHGLRAYYLSAQSVDLGACPHTVSQCPAVSAQPSP